MKRRNFLSAAGVLPLLSPTRAAAESGAASHRTRIDLNGTWERSIAGRRVGSLAVPCSLPPSGRYELTRTCAVPRLVGGQRAFLHFEAITYFARVFLNGVEVGVMDPYVPHEFEITRGLKEGNNEIRVALADLVPESNGAGSDQIRLGVSPGWEAYGGIIRDVWVELRPAAFVENANFSYTLAAGFGSAGCRTVVYVNATQQAAGRAVVSLKRGQRTVASGTREFSGSGAVPVEIAFEVSQPGLWSPESPDLYDVSVVLETSAGTDMFSFRTGFRTFRTNGPNFELNGNRVILNGVCRHDMWKDQGFTLTRQQMEYDMRTIKAMGANFVRLVHYPHDRYIVDLADELGLMVTEEPGYWQVNFAKLPRTTIDLGFRILEKTIRRDWNSPSVIAWLLANESRLTVPYLREGKAMCLRLDPWQRLVSAANDTGKEKAKPIFEESEMDFFDDHPYTFDVGEFEKIAAYYGPSRPLTFTEWGGKEIGQSPQVMPHSVDMILELQEQNRMAGTAFWSWQDLAQFSRIDQEMRNGILESGMVTESREPRQEIVMELSRLWEGRRTILLPRAERPELVPLRHAPWAPGARLDPVNLADLAAGQAQSSAWAAFEAALAGFWPKEGYAGDQWQRTGEKFLLWRSGRLDILGAPFETPAVEGYARPLVLTPSHPSLSIPIGRACSRIHVLGHISCPGGFPPGGASGSQAGEIRLEYSDGSSEQIPLRHGYEVARGNLIYKCGRIDPIATEAQRALLFVKDTAREQYQVLLYSLDTKGRKVAALHYRLNAGEQPLLLFAVTTESV